MNMKFATGLLIGLSFAAGTALAVTSIPYISGTLTSGHVLVATSDGLGVQDGGGGVGNMTGSGASTTGDILCSNNTSTPLASAVDCSGPILSTDLGRLSTTQAYTGAKSFQEVHGTSTTVTLTTNNYTAAVTDCGGTLKLPPGTTPTVTLPNVNPSTGECSIKFIQTTSGSSLYTFQAASGGTLQTDGGDGLLHSKAQYAVVVATLLTPSGSAAVWVLSGNRS